MVDNASHVALSPGSLPLPRPSDYDRPVSHTKGLNTYSSIEHLHGNAEDM